jgi:hypothetical protein
MKKSEFTTLIKMYLSAADNCCAALALCAGGNDLLGAWLGGRLPRRGHVFRQFTFTFHGRGCRFTRGRLEVDVDFEFNGEWDAFDVWRLHRFARSFEEFSGASLEDMTEMATLLLTDGIIVQTMRSPNRFRMKEFYPREEHVSKNDTDAIKKSKGAGKA